MSERISVILPTYNRVQTLDRAIQSVWEQSFSDWHLYVVDDGSTDGTQDLLQKWETQIPDLSVITLKKNSGVSAARNAGIKKSKGEWLCFLDSDDQWLSEKLQKQIAFAEENNKFSIVHGEEVWVRNGVRVNAMKKHSKSGGWIFENCLKLCCISPSTVMIKRSLLNEVGLFREDFPVCEDYDLWLRICCKYEVGFVNDDLIVKYGGHEDQLSRKYKAMDYWRVKAIESVVNNSHLKPHWREAAVTEVVKRKNILLRGYRRHENLKCYDELFFVSL